MSFRTGFYFGLLAALALGLFLFRLWQPEFQIQKHSEHLLDSITNKDWARFGQFIADTYSDQWGNDRELLVQRSREIFRTVRGLRITGIGSTVRVENERGFWRANIQIDADERSELAAELKNRVNSIKTPFELEWRRVSGKPWDWKLVSVNNPELNVSTDF